MNGEKALLRKKIRATLSAMSPETRRASDSALFARFLTLPQVKSAGMIFAYWGISGHEPDTGALVERLVSLGKQAALPCTLPHGQLEFRLFISRETLRAGPHGIMEPSPLCPVIPANAADLILVPALCCDKLGFRLGQGGGYYDRWLEAHPCPSVCMCRDAILQDKLPAEAHDRPVDAVLTESRIFP